MAEDNKKNLVTEGLKLMSKDISINLSIKDLRHFLDGISMIKKRGRGTISLKSVYGHCKLKCAYNGTNVHFSYSNAYSNITIEGDCSIYQIGSALYSTFEKMRTYQ